MREIFTNKEDLTGKVLIGVIFAGTAGCATLLGSKYPVHWALSFLVLGFFGFARFVQIKKKAKIDWKRFFFFFGIPLFLIPMLLELGAGFFSFLPAFFTMTVGDFFYRRHQAKKTRTFHPSEILVELSPEQAKMFREMQARSNSEEAAALAAQKVIAKAKGVLS